MYMELLIIFIILTILFFIISIITMEDNPKLSIPFIMMGMIMSILCSYGIWRVDFLYVDYNATFGNSSIIMYSSWDYGDPYSYIFIFIFFIFFIMFFRAGFNMWKEALMTQGEMNYNNRKGK